MKAVGIVIVFGFVFCFLPYNMKNDNNEKKNLKMHETLLSTT